jgi:hypothetical protein
MYLEILPFEVVDVSPRELLEPIVNIIKCDRRSYSVGIAGKNIETFYLWPFGNAHHEKVTSLP